MADLSNLTSLDELAYANRTSSSGSSSSETKTRGSSELGKEQFLQLLVCQMQNQDPLNPQDDTEFISQLAQFSSLEQMMSMNDTMTNSSAYTLVGKQVLIKHQDALGNTKEVTGTVDYVEIKDGEAYLSIDGTQYSMDELAQVLDTTYAVKDKLPSVAEQNKTYDISNPADVEIKIDLGKDGYEASSVAVALNGEFIDADLMKYEDGVLTISSKAFEKLDADTYYLGFYFNDPYSTTVTDKVQVKVVDSGIEKDA